MSATTGTLEAERPAVDRMARHLGYLIDDDPRLERALTELYRALGAAIAGRDAVTAAADAALGGSA
jgi:hypothetical protein